MFSHYSSFIPLVLVLFVWGTFVTLGVTVTNIFFYFFSVLKFTLEDVDNISAISRRPVLLMEETREHGENHHPVGSH